MKMTPKERVYCAIAHKEADVCPHQLHFPDNIRQRLVEFTGDANFDRDLVLHLVGAGPRYPETNVRVDATHYRDAFGVVWEESFPGEIGMVMDPVLKEPSLKGYNFPPTRVPGLFDQTPQDVAAHKSQFAVWSLGFSLFERAWSLRGLEGFMMDLVDSPAFAEELLDRICEVNCDLIKQACQQPIDGVRFGDDWGAQKGMMMGADHWRQFIKPRFARMVATARAGGKKTLLHSDGDIIEIIPDLIEVGLDVLNPVQPDVMDIYEIKRRFGKNLTLFGGVSVQQFLPYAKPAEVRAEVRKLIRQLGAGGGLIIAPTHELGRDIPLENLLAMMEEFSRQHLSQ